MSIILIGFAAPALEIVQPADITGKDLTRGHLPDLFALSINQPINKWCCSPALVQPLIIPLQKPQIYTLYPTMAEKSFKYVIIGSGVSAVSAADPLIILYLILILFFIHV